MTANNPSLYYAAELAERLETLEGLRNSESMTRGLVTQLAVVTLIVPVLALLIGWLTL